MKQSGSGCEALDQWLIKRAEVVETQGKIKSYSTYHDDKEKRRKREKNGLEFFLSS